ncbi:DUF452 family protein [bacterium]|nr:DUF452 family protein [bacterium]
MQYNWLNKGNNNELIVFFNGWGMDDNIVRNLDCSDYDILTFCDYRTFEPLDFDFSSYEKKYLIGWSMGVYVCNFFYEKFNSFDKFIAINGTQKPIDDNYGIPIAAYNLTVENFNDLTCSKFFKKISPVVDLKGYCTRPKEELKQELISIRDLKIQNYFKFNKAILSTKDRIFPYKNMYKYWEEQNTPIVEIQSAHYIFDKYKNWSELL